MDENKNPESRYDVDEEEGATTVLRAMDAETEDEEEGATTVLRAKICHLRMTMIRKVQRRF